MFSFLSTKRSIEAAPYIRRVIDVTTPNRMTPQEGRRELRYNRSFPVTYCPWKKDTVFVEEVSIAFTQDLSDHGLGILSVQPIEYDELVVSVWPDPVALSDPYHFLASVRDRRSAAAGIWAIGLMIEGFLNESHRYELASLDKIARNVLQIDRSPTAPIGP